MGKHLQEVIDGETSPRRELRGCRRDRGSGRGIRNETNMDESQVVG